MPRTRPLHLSTPASGGLPLDQLVADASSALDDSECGTLLRITDHPLRLGYRPLDGQHPLDLLLGFTAPLDWLAIGVHCRGRAYQLDQPSSDPQAVLITTLVDRAGRGAGLLRYLPAAPPDPPTPPGGAAHMARGTGTGTDASAHSRAVGVGVPGRPDDGASLTHYDDAPEGMIGDACRRALGLPTPPPPESTAELWLRLWLDRMVEAAVFTDRHDRPDRRLSWPDIVALHPAAAAALSPDDHGWLATAPEAIGGPYAVAEATLALAESWPWARLRRDPEALAHSGPPLSSDLAAWMDDGMFARVVLADLAPLPALARSTRLLLPQPLLEDIDEAVLATGLNWSPGSEQVAS